MCWSRKKNPSQVAHAETPRPISSFSPGTFKGRKAEPVARMTARAAYSASPTHTRLISPVRSTRVTSSATSSAPKRSACLRH